MKKIILFLLLLPTIVFALTQEFGSFKNFVYKDDPGLSYSNWQSHIVEGIARDGYNIYAPYDRQTDGFGTFRIPTETELLHWNEVIKTFARGNLQLTENLINQHGFPYEVVEFSDTDSQRILYILRENVNPNYTDDNGTEYTGDDEIGSFDYGWGLYVYSPSSDNPIVVSAPHPNDDFVTTVTSVECFLRWDSRYLMISGAGREVEWQGWYYTNSRSISDPSRNPEHPFQYAYKAFCDEIRRDFDRREFSAQLHSYDWNRHEGHAATQISAGNYNPISHLPLRDNSSLHRDMINYGNFVVFPADSLGIHSEITIDDYYAFYGETVYYHPENGETHPITGHVDLPGYRNSHQTSYTLDGYNRYDVFEPFFHIEMDELPDCYEQDENTYKAFYGYDFLRSEFNPEYRFDRTLAFYEPWIYGMEQALNHMWELDDEQVPVVGSIEVADNGTNEVRIAWEPVDCYDIYSYEILYATEPITDGNYTVIDREQQENLADATTNNGLITGLQTNNVYYFALRVKDYNGNYSNLSNQVQASTGAASVNNLTALGLDSKVKINFNAGRQVNNQGFKIKKSQNPDGPFTTITSYENNPNMQGSNLENQAYSFTDYDVQNGQNYYYKVASVDNTNFEQTYFTTAFAAARKLYKISFECNGLVDTLYFGMNPDADDQQDTLYDVEDNEVATNNFMFAQFNEVEWEFPTFNTLVCDDFDTTDELRKFTIRTKTDQVSNINISLANNNQRFAETMYIVHNNNYVNLLEGNYQYANTDTSFTYIDFYWGALKPNIFIDDKINTFLKQGEEIDFSWNIEHNQIINNIQLFATNSNQNFTVVENLSGSSTNYTWQIPEIIADSLNLVVKATTISGDVITKKSRWMFGVVDDEISFSGNAGWQTVGYPVTNNNAIADVFGEGANIWNIDDTTFVQANQLSNNAFWLNSPSNFSFNQNSALLLPSPYSQSLHMGWNLVFNPHPFNYYRHQLQFNSDDIIISWYDAASGSLILPDVLVYENNRFNKVDEIKIGQSFYIWSNSDDAEIVFAPYVDNPRFEEPELNWKFDVVFTQNNESDYVSFGVSSIATENIDNLLDKTDFPNTPVHDKPNAYIVHEDSEGYLTNLQQLVDYTFVNNMNVIRDYKTVLNCEPNSSVLVSVESDDYPEDYQIAVVTEDAQGAYLHPGRSFRLNPGAASNNIKVFIMNHWVDSDDNVNSLKKLSLNNYPNPFNPNTNISYYLPSKQKVKINVYNVKGQLVKTLVNDVKNAGNNSIVWQGKNNTGNTVGSGIYFLQLKTKNKTLSKKMLLIK